MSTFVARALINRLLSDNERKSLKKVEKDLQTQLDSAGHHQRGRFLAGFEVCRLFHLKPDPVPETESDRMQSLLWIWKKKKDAEFDADREHYEGLANEYERLLDWLDYAEQEYAPPMPQYGSRT